MKLTILALTLALAATVASRACVTQAQANQLVTRFIGILDHQGSDLGSANATAQAILTPGYEEISDSILSLEGRPLGTVTLPNRTAFINNVLGNPAQTGIETIGVFPAGCTHVLWQWDFTGIGSKQYEIKGFNFFSTDSKLKFTKAYIEFNSIAWGLDTGCTVNCSAHG